MPEIPGYRQKEKNKTNQEVRGGIFSRFRQKVHQLFNGVERQKQSDSQRDKVYFPPSATIQIDVKTDKVVMSQQSLLMAEINMSSGESLQIRWNSKSSRFQYSMQTSIGNVRGDLTSNKALPVGGCELRLRANQTVQIKSINGGICSFDQRICNAQDAYSRPNEFNQIPSQSREQLALQRLSRNPRFSNEDDDSPYGYLDALPIRGNLSESLAGGVYVGGPKAREAVYIPKISDQTPALNGLYKQILQRVSQRGSMAAQYILQDVVELVRSQISTQLSTGSDRVTAWLNANCLNEDGLINLENFVQYQIGSSTHVALIVALLLETLIDRNVILGRVRVEENHQPGVGGHASITYTADTHEIQIDPSRGYIGRRTALSNGWNYDVTFRMNRQERKALEKTCKAAKLPQRQQDAHQTHERAWQKHDEIERVQPKERRLQINLREPSKTKVERSLRRIPAWIVDDLLRIEPLSDKQKRLIPGGVKAWVTPATFGKRSEMRCNEDIIDSLPQSEVDKTIAHEVGGHVLMNSVLSKSRKEGRRILDEREAFARANFSMIMKDGYAKSILTGTSSYEKRLRKKTGIDPTSAEPPQDKWRLHYAIDEFLANRMSEYLQTASGVEYGRTFHHRERPFTDEENRKCWQFCSMIYQSGEKLFTKQRS